MRTIEICAGAGGQAIGLHHAGAEHVALVEIDKFACSTLHHNNQKHSLNWGEIHECDLRQFIENEAIRFAGEIDLVAGGVPCPPFSKAGKQLGSSDDRDLFPQALKLVEIVRPLAVMIENVPGLMDSQFDDYRSEISENLERLGYRSEWKKLNACDFGVPQLRPRAILVAIIQEHFELFNWPEKPSEKAETVGEALYEFMASNGWQEAESWREKANRVAPTIVGGSKKHGGPDLGPTRAKKQWKLLSVNAHRVADAHEIPGRDFDGVRMKDGRIREDCVNMPQLTIEMVAKLQGFPKGWEFIGSKTHAYRQVGNAFPPPVAEAVGREIKKTIERISQTQSVNPVQAAQ